VDHRSPELATSAIFTKTQSSRELASKDAELRRALDQIDKVFKIELVGKPQMLTNFVPCSSPVKMPH
jgi:hypothetical protein